VSKQRGGESGDSPLVMFAEELKAHRELAGLSQVQLGELIAYSPSLVAKIETCGQVPSRDFAEGCDKALGTPGTFVRMQRQCPRVAYPGWFWPYLDREAEAAVLRSWQPLVVLVVDGLLQTEEYARAILRAARPRDSGEKIDQLVTARMDRQAILSREDPPDLWVIIDESALRRPVGEPGVMSGQLDRLLAAARQPGVTVQVMPVAAGAHPGLLGSLVIASFDSAPDIAYLDNALTGQLVERREDVKNVQMLYDTLRAEALAPRASEQLIAEVVGEWT
jgi:transcriptional regulator with XRE-family HTH domain